ncbi:glycosyltransferase family 4 protein [Dyella sp. A6]|uniref:glycosyltransferase family 4 protein n=1 Tax=Dyella aluminiiresistens TaxID=3069105 RepID=UPI002E7A28E6|nr:glycosyltransferase family 4 protein [Dyella sp. A6]
MTETRRPRILLVTRNLPPLVGGMERLNWHMAEELSRYADVRVIGPAGSAAMRPAGVRVYEVTLRPLWKFLLHAQWRALCLALTWKPDVILAGSGLTTPIAWCAARASGARTATYVHGLDLAVRHPVYRGLWLPALRHIDRVIANSRSTAALARAAGVSAERIGIVHPGVDLPVEHVAVGGSVVAAVQEAEDKEPADFRERHQFGSRPLLLSVGRLSTRKGLREFVAQALPHIVEAYPDALLVVVGDTPTDALHAQAQTPESVRAAAEQGGVGQNLCFLGTITDYRELGSVYRAANVHVFPVRDIPGDPEGFGMVAVEAAAHGLPTVAFATGGVVDAVAEGESGCLVASDDYAGFAEAVRRVLSGCGSLSGSSRVFAEQFIWPRFGERLWQLLLPVRD